MKSEHDLQRRMTGLANPPENFSRPEKMCRANHCVELNGVQIQNGKILSLHRVTGPLIDIRSNSAKMLSLLNAPGSKNASKEMRPSNSDLSLYEAS